MERSTSSTHVLWNACEEVLYRCVSSSCKRLSGQQTPSTSGTQSLIAFQIHQLSAHRFHSVPGLKIRRNISTGSIDRVDQLDFSYAAHPSRRAKHRRDQGVTSTSHATPMEGARREPMEHSEEPVNTQPIGRSAASETSSEKRILWCQCAHITRQDMFWRHRDRAFSYELGRANPGILMSWARRLFWCQCVSFWLFIVSCIFRLMNRRARNQSLKFGRQRRANPSSSWWKVTDELWTYSRSASSA